jgi:BlaI family penicillinase repressor
MPDKPPRLGTGELEVLEMLWRDGPLSLSEAHDAFAQPIGYTTVQTRLNRLVKKGVVKKSKNRPACYSAAVTREQVNRHDLDLLVDRVNQGKFIPLVAHLVNDRRLNQGEIDELKSLIADAESKALGKTKRGKNA